MSVCREIGGYFELENFSGENPHDGQIALNCGRACAVYIAELRGISRAWLPDYLCSSVSDALSRMGVDVEVYPISGALLPAYDRFLDRVHPGDWLYLVDYFGALAKSDEADALRLFNGSVIVDEAHGYFREPWYGADTIYTCRKFFGVPDGGYLATRDCSSLSRQLERDESYRRMGFVLGRFERAASEFYQESSENNHFFANEPIKSMSPLTENLLRAIDYERAAKIRKQNWDVLDSELGDCNLLWGEVDRRAPDVPFMYPLLVGDASGIREHLAERGIYVPTLWPNVLCNGEAGSVACHYAANILPLPVDQRYGEEDMRHIVKSIRAIAAGCDVPPKGV